MITLLLITAALLVWLGIERNRHAVTHKALETARHHAVVLHLEVLELKEASRRDLCFLIQSHAAHAGELSRLIADLEATQSQYSESGLPLCDCGCGAEMTPFDDWKARDGQIFTPEHYRALAQQAIQETPVTRDAEADQAERDASALRMLGRKGDLCL